LETLGYVLIYFLKGKLDWQGLKNKTGQKKYDSILKIKKSIKMSQLCNGLPEEFGEFIQMT
jgi:hypothetical protein